ncbi:myosin IC heavy chain [Pyrenophora tritici-repentis]|nr:myosin IC heavy chain [Pyrenophora tritici-repentis]
MGKTNRAARKAGGAQPAARAQPKSQFATKAVFETTKKKEVGVSDLTLISKISNEAINENLKKRFENGEIYTYIGHVLVSVNPFRDLGIYTDQVLESYKGKNRLEVRRMATQTPPELIRDRCHPMSSQSQSPRTTT